MKISTFPAILSLLITAILAYWAYYIAHSNSDSNDAMVLIGTAVSTISTLGLVFACKTKNEKVSINVKLVGILTFILLMIINFVYANIGVKMPDYLLIDGIILIAYLLIVWNMSKIDDV